MSACPPVLQSSPPLFWSNPMESGTTEQSRAGTSTPPNVSLTVVPTRPIYDENRDSKLDDLPCYREEQQLQLQVQIGQQERGSEQAIANDEVIPVSVVCSDEEIAQMVQDILSEEADRQLDAATKFRKLLSGGNPPIEKVIKSDIVPRFVEFLQDEKSLLQLEAAWVLTNIAAGTAEHTTTVVNAGAVPNLVKLLSSPDLDVSSHAIWALGNLAGENTKYRDYVLEEGALPPLLMLLNKDHNLGLRRIAVWMLANLCSRRDPRPEWHLIGPAITVIPKLIYSTDDEILVDACRATSCLFYQPGYDVQVMISSDVCERLVELLAHSSTAIAARALDSIGNIVTGDDHMTQLVIDQGALPALRSLLSSPEERIRKTACWTISNITAGPPRQIQSVIDANIIPPLNDILQNADLRTRREACWAIRNATDSNPQILRRLVSQGCIKPLCDMLAIVDETVRLTLEALDNILRVGEADKKSLGYGAVNQYAQYVKEAGGIHAIRELQSHHDFHVYSRVNRIIYEYFPCEEDLDLAINAPSLGTLHSEPQSSFT